MVQGELSIQSIESMKIPPWKKQGWRKKSGLYSPSSISLPIKVVLVQPKEGNARSSEEVRRREPLQKIEISPDFGRLGGGGPSTEAVRGGDRRPQEPPPLPEPARVDKDQVLREILSSVELPSPQPPPPQQNNSEEGDGREAELEEVPLEQKRRVPTSPLPSVEDTHECSRERERLVRLFEQLLSDIYPERRQEGRLTRRASDYRISRGADSRAKLNRHHSHSGYLETLSIGDKFYLKTGQEPLDHLNEKCWSELSFLVEELSWRVKAVGQELIALLEERDRLDTEHQGLCDLMTASLQALSNKTSEDTDVRFSVSPGGGDSGFGEWAKAMKMVARLPDGVPPHFRKTLWLSLAEKHLASKNVSWSHVERVIFSDRLNPDDQELSVQIVKDLHRTGCSLFCGTSGQHNQAVLKRVLLAYARWNKAVGYCQGLNMLAALILQVMQGCQGATVKVMIYLIEGVLPESYFADNLRGLSVDMAVFRDLLSLKVPELSKHLDALQQEARESGTSYEPPLMDVFTMQWFLTIFCNCLPQATVLRLWDLLLLEGDTVLIKAALVIWQNLSERMLSVRSADEFYSIMAVLTREMMEFGLMDANNIIKAMDLLSIPELNELRERYVYNISPWPVAAKKGLRIFYPQQGGVVSEEPRMTPISNHPDREKIALDITALKKQYWKLRERQRQAHIILSAACRNDSYSPQSSPALNHLLLGKSALKSVKARSRPGETLHWRDTHKQERRPSLQAGALREGERSRRRPVERRRVSSSSSSSSSTELCDSSGDSATEESPTQTASPSAAYIPASSPIDIPLTSGVEAVLPRLSPPLTVSARSSSLPLTSATSSHSLSTTTSSHQLPVADSFQPRPTIISSPPLLASTSSPIFIPPTSPVPPLASTSPPSLLADITSPPSPMISPNHSFLPSSSTLLRNSVSPLSSVPAASTSSSYEGLPPPLTSPTEAVPKLVDEAVRKRDELMRILKENSEMLGKFRHHSTSPVNEKPPPPKLSNHSPDEPDDIKDIRRRYSFAGT